MKKFRLQFSPKQLLLIVLSCSIPGITAAQLNVLDPTFGNNGFVINKLHEAGGSDVAETSVLQPDGKTVLAGYTSIGSTTDSNDIAVLRFNDDGSIDPSFGNDGRVVIDISNSNDFIYSMALQSDGKLVLAGKTFTDISGGIYSRLLVVRLLANGLPDSSFAGDGIYNFDYSANGEALYNVAVLPDGKILAAGTVTSTTPELLLLRLLDDGTPDASFGGDGFVQVSGHLLMNPMKLAIDPSSRILISGQTTTGGRFGVERYKSNGVIDSSFGIDGLAAANIDMAADIPYTLKISSDGKIVVAGNSKDPVTGWDRVAICRLSANGIPDNSFGSNGRVITPFPNFMGIATSLSISPTGKIIAGVIWNDVFFSDYGFLLLGYKENGIIDSLFGADGFIQTKLSSEVLTYNSDLHVNSNNEINFTSTAKHGISNNDFFMAQFNDNGTRHLSFGNNGETWGDLIPAASDEGANYIAWQSDESMMIGGSFAYGVNSDFLVAHYKTDGTMEESFGGTGFVRIDIDDLSDHAQSILNNPDGSFFVCGYSHDSIDEKQEATVAKLKADGRLDFDFGDHGIVETTLGELSAVPVKYLLQPDNKIVGCGAVLFSSTTWKACIFRLNSDGTNDNTFSDDGLAEYELPSSGLGVLRDIALLSDGSILCCGYHDATGVLIKLLSNGTFDNSFGNNGVVTFVASTLYSINSLVVQQDGSIVLSGSGQIAGNVSLDYMLFRFLSNGDPDINFGLNGTSFINHDNYDDWAAEIGVLADGRITVTGEYDAVSNDSAEVCLLMLTNAGDPDYTFSGDGWAAFDAQGHVDESHCLRVQPDDKVIVGGLSYAPEGGYDLVLSRFNTSFATGLNEISDNTTELFMYPNPAQESVTIENPFYHFNYATDHSIQVSVRNILGEILSTTLFEKDASVFKLTLENFAAGIYVMEVSVGNNHLYNKLIKE